MTGNSHLRRSRAEWAAIVGLPLLANLLLAGYLLTQLEDGSLPVVGGTDNAVPAVAPPEQPLAESSWVSIVRTAEESATDVDYACGEPWRPSDEVWVWTCRADDLLAVLYGLGPNGVYRLDVTWFGFDETRSSLPAWAGAAFDSAAGARTVAAWVADNSGRQVQTRVDGVTVQVGGSAGARTLVVHGDR